MEVLVPDFRGDAAALAAVLAAGPEVLNHNVETVPHLYRRVRPDADYAQSLRLLAAAAAYRDRLAPAMRTKSGIMVGLGETPEQVLDLMADWRRAKVDIATIGQYLPPTHLTCPWSASWSPRSSRCTGARAWRWASSGCRAAPWCAAATTPRKASGMTRTKSAGVLVPLALPACPCETGGVIHQRLPGSGCPPCEEAEPRLEVRGWHPRDAPDDAWLRDAEGLFVWNLPPGLVARMPRLAWIQNSGAGVDHLVDHAEIPPGVPITRADGQFGLWMARYTCAHLLQEALRVDACRAAQGERRWAAELVPENLTGWWHWCTASAGSAGRSGGPCGSWAWKSTGSCARPAPMRSSPCTPGRDLGAWLGGARVLVLCAPLTSGTRGLVDASLLGHGHAGLTLVNVGRGEQVAVPDLLEALDRGRLGRAVLDVLPREPLEAGVAPLGPPRGGGHPPPLRAVGAPGLIPDILENLHRFAQGQPILNAVDRTLGY